MRINLILLPALQSRARNLWGTMRASTRQPEQDTNRALFFKFFFLFGESRCKQSWELRVYAKKKQPDLSVNVANMHTRFFFLINMLRFDASTLLQCNALLSSLFRAQPPVHLGYIFNYVSFSHSCQLPNWGVVRWQERNKTTTIDQATDGGPRYI